MTAQKCSGGDPLLLAHPISVVLREVVPVHDDERRPSPLLLLRKFSARDNGVRIL